jgi:hypothetical protein
MHANKVHHVITITHVAVDLGKGEDWLRDVASETKIEDGVHLGLWRRRRSHPGVHRLRYRKPDRARPDVQRKSNLVQALATRMIQLACGPRRMRTPNPSIDRFYAAGEPLFERASAL